MDKNSFKKLVRELLEEGLPSPEHERLKDDLAAWAAAKGFTKVYPGLRSGSKPDVLRADKTKENLFLGDAKNSENENVDNTETLDRLQGYFHSFGRLLGQFKGGYLAVATDSAEEAKRWVPVLNLLAKMAHITAKDLSPPNFQVFQLPGKNTWIIFW